MNYEPYPEELSDLTQKYQSIDPSEVVIPEGSNLTPKMADFIRNHSARAGIKNPAINLKGAAPGEMYDLAKDSGVQSSPSPYQTLIGQNPQLLEMLKNYMPSNGGYGEELRKASEESHGDTQAFNDMIKKAMSQKSEGPSKAEMYFRLAAAFGAPTKTGSFVESLGNAGTAMADHNKAVRENEQASNNRITDLGITAAKMQADSSKANLNNLRTLAGEEMKDRRTMLTEMLKEYVNSGKPQSEAGKFALDAGLRPGTPEYTKFVDNYLTNKLESGNVFKSLTAGIAEQNLQLAKDREERMKTETIRKAEDSKKLTPKEVDLKRDSQDTITNSEQALKDLSEAFKLNQHSYSGSWVDRAQYLALSKSGSEDQKVKNTERMENLLGQAAIGKLKASFGGNPTEGERTILLELEGAKSKNTETRKEIIARAYAALKARTNKERARLKDIEEGKYRLTTPEVVVLPEELK